MSKLVRKAGVGFYLPARGTNSFVDNIVVYMTLNTNPNVVLADSSCVTE